MVKFIPRTTPRHRIEGAHKYSTPRHVRDTMGGKKKKYTKSACPNANETRTFNLIVEENRKDLPDMASPDMAEDRGTLPRVPSPRSNQVNQNTRNVIPRQNERAIPRLDQQNGGNPMPHNQHNHNHGGNPIPQN